MKKGVKVTLGMLFLSMVLIACSNASQEDTLEEGTSEETANETDTEASELSMPLDVAMSEDEKYSNEAVVLVINSQEVLGEAYNAAYVDTLRFLRQSNQDTEDKTMLKQQTLQTLQTNTLIEQDAEERGIHVTDEDIQMALDETKSQFETDDAYQEALAQLAYTEESFIQSLELQLLQQKYLDEAVDVEAVTDQEVDEYYDLLQQQSDDLPALEEVKEQMVLQLEQTKTQQAFQAQVESLMADAEIEERI